MDDVTVKLTAVISFVIRLTFVLTEWMTKYFKFITLQNKKGKAELTKLVIKELHTWLLK